MLDAQSSPLSSIFVLAKPKNILPIAKTNTKISKNDNGIHLQLFKFPKKHLNTSQAYFNNTKSRRVPFPSAKYFKKSTSTSRITSRVKREEILLSARRHRIVNKEILVEHISQWANLNSFPDLIKRIKSQYTNRPSTTRLRTVSLVRKKRNKVSFEVKQDVNELNKRNDINNKSNDPSKLYKSFIESQQLPTTNPQSYRLLSKERNSQVQGKYVRRNRNIIESKPRQTWKYKFTL